MRLGHVIYVVKNLDAAVKEWRKKVLPLSMEGQRNL